MTDMKRQRRDEFSRSHQYVTVLLDALRDPVRRQMMDVLQRHGEPVSLADVAEQVAEQQYHTSITNISADDVKHVYLDLYHRHVPKLSRAGLITYYQDRDLVRLGETGSPRNGLVV